ncbi:STAS domain-containing protein [Amycolatopsis suaedae]|uniref:STAS domain-containing protein n=1 Tax=Amycolatopsis suaedae TaxID=2510978 RepID=A0A4Q7IZM3_9PSEU|nr:STAS domain-containing protein [Amycolatopsis suaedae]RZQ60510.1 STAS domain-containing protein [Amycolatopsis suaedae]
MTLITDSVADFLDAHQREVIEAWSRASAFRSVDPTTATEEATELLAGLARAVRAGAADDPASEGFAGVRTLLRLLVTRSGGGPRPDVSEFKDPLLALWNRWEGPGPDDRLAGAVLLSTAVDTLRVVLVELELSSGADMISAQQQQLTELSTPVIKLWDRVLAIPLIGTLDSMRSQAATELLLEEIVTQQARVAILDITGVPTVDTMVAQHLLRTAMAARLMGAECIISGIRPQIAQTMVQLGIDLGEVVTKANLAHAFAYSLNVIGLAVTQAEHG